MDDENSVIVAASKSGTKMRICKPTIDKMRLSSFVWKKLRLELIVKNSLLLILNLSGFIIEQNRIQMCTEVPGVADDTYIKLFHKVAK